MLYMVTEKFKQGSLEGIRDRFQEKGRMLPDGVEYRASWVTPDGKRCFQVMESPNLESLEEWTSRWKDLVEFEIAPVLTLSEFWEQFERARHS